MKFDKAKKRHSFKNGDQEDLNKVNRLEATGEKYLKNILTGYRLPTTNMWTHHSDPQSILKCDILKSFKDETLTYEEIMGD